MTRISILLASAAMTIASAGAASADCAADIAALRANDLTATGSTTAEGGKTTNYDAASGSATAPATGAISKDGSTAPLEAAGSADKTARAVTPNAATGGTTTTPGQTAEGGSVSKDGSTAPLASAAGGTDPQIATSGQDAASQQSGLATAASGASTDAALDKAQKAADAGDEQACQQALKAIKG